MTVYYTVLFNVCTLLYLGVARVIAVAEFVGFGIDISRFSLIPPQLTNVVCATVVGGQNDPFFGIL